MKIRYLGHSCFHIHTQDQHLIVDPYIRPNEKASHIAFEELKADFILLTHGHGDHVADAADLAQNTGAEIISSYEIVQWYGKQDIDGVGMNIGGQASFPFGMLKYVTAIHSSTLPDWTPGGNPGGFVIWNDEGCIYIAGDTALTLDMQLIPRLCPALDLAIMPIGDFFTMSYKEAVIAADFVQCGTVIGCHYDTFPPIEIDKEAAKKVFTEAGKKLILLDIGETHDV